MSKQNRSNGIYDWGIDVDFYEHSDYQGNKINRITYPTQGNFSRNDVLSSVRINKPGAKWIAYTHTNYGGADTGWQTASSPNGIPTIGHDEATSFKVEWRDDAINQTGAKEICCGVKSNPFGSKFIQQVCQKQAGGEYQPSRDGCKNIIATKEAEHAAAEAAAEKENDENWLKYCDDNGWNSNCLNSWALANPEKAHDPLNTWCGQSDNYRSSSCACYPTGFNSDLAAWVKDCKKAMPDPSYHSMCETYSSGSAPAIAMCNSKSCRNSPTYKIFDVKKFGCDPQNTKPCNYLWMGENDGEVITTCKEIAQTQQWSIEDAAAAEQAALDSAAAEAEALAAEEAAAQAEADALALEQAQVQSQINQANAEAEAALLAAEAEIAQADAAIAAANAEAASAEAAALAQAEAESFQTTMMVVGMGLLVLCVLGGIIYAATKAPKKPAAGTKTGSTAGVVTVKTAFRTRRKR